MSLLKGLILITIVFGAVYFSFRSGNIDQGSVTQAVPAPGFSDVDEMIVVEQGNVQDEGGTMEIGEIVVEGDDYSFSPARFSVSAGESVKLTLNNVGRFPHNLIVEGLGIATRTIPGGASDTIEFSVEEAGTYTIYCGIGNHRALGMTGVLTIE